ncbi:MAG: hypothetical protein N2C14_29315, partial [Planctomycetales bacterium]
AEHQWRFIKAAIAHATTDDDLGHIAAGPMEHLLGRHGDDFIDQIEEFAASNSKFAKMMTGVWKHMTSDQVWGRVEAIQAACPDKLGGNPD